MTRFEQDSELKKIFLSIHKREFELNLPHATENLIGFEQLKTTGINRTC